MVPNALKFVYVDRDNLSIYAQLRVSNLVNFVATLIN